MERTMMKRVVPALCGLLALLGVVVGTTGLAHAIAGAQSSATLEMPAIFSDSLVQVNLMTTEAIATSTSPTNFVIQVPTPSPIGWQDVQVNTSITDSAYNASAAGADSTGPSVSQFAMAVADRHGQYQADALALHDVTFVATGDGTLTVSAAYDILLQVYKDTASEFASGYYLAGLYLRNLTQNTESPFEVTRTVAFAAGDAANSFFEQITGTMTTSLAFAIGDAGSFRIIVDGHAEANSVPEPSTFALLGIGLLGAGLLRKRTRR